MTRTLALLVALALSARAVPYVAHEACASDADCLHGFPATVPTLVCNPETSLCEARNPHWCADAADCKEALTTCIANRCAYGARGAPCTTRADCGIGLYCTAQGMCKHGNAGASCSPATAVECANGLTCSPGGKCVASAFNSRCVLDRNCAIGMYCETGRCAYGDKRTSPFYFAWGTPPPLLPTPSVLPEVSLSLVELTTAPQNLVGDVPLPSMDILPEASVAPLVEVPAVNAALGGGAPEPSAEYIVEGTVLPLAPRMGRTADEPTEETGPVTIGSLPTAIPVRQRVSGASLVGMSEIFLYA